MATNAFIVTSFEHITFLKRTEKWFLFWLGDFLWEGNTSAILREIRLEAASLTHCVRPRLVTVENCRILFGVSISTNVLRAFIGVQ